MDLHLVYNKNVLDSKVYLLLNLDFGFCSFDELQRCGTEHLKQALSKAIDEAQRNADFSTMKPPHRVKQISVSSVINKRRRQEDRWFFEPDLVAYAPLNKVCSLLS